MINLPSLNYPESGKLDNRRYREYFLPEDVEQLRLLLVVGSIVVLSLAVIDYLFDKLSWEFFLLLAIRLVFVGIATPAIFRVEKVIGNNHAKADLIYMIFWILLGVVLIAVDITRPPSYVQNQSLYILVIFNCYTMTPGRSYNKVIPATIISTAALLIIIFIKDPVPVPTLGMMIALMLITHLLGLLLAAREERHRRQQYTIKMREEQALLEMERLATTDGLTGLFNRRRFLEGVEAEMARFKRLGDVFCLLMLDFDHFKEINDQYGHQAGDEVLRQFAALIPRVVRTTDIVGRVGGEEFAIACPATTVENARILAERILAMCAQIQIPGAERPSCVTVSIGVSQVLEQDPNLDHLWQRADQALYHAKEGGRNRVEEVL